MEECPGMTKEEAIELHSFAHKFALTVVILMTAAEGWVLGALVWERNGSEDRKGRSGKLAAEVEEVW
jgi:hypothetical protein